MIRSVAVGRW